MSGLTPDALRAACAGYDRVGVAVSGGGDSVAALVMLVEALGAARVCAVTVDHGLRPESAEEARGVGALCARLGVGHDVLRWKAAVKGNLQAQARAARFALIAEWARGRVGAVVLAHTIDDQAETVMMRIERGSGVDGLAAMAPQSVRDGVMWLRPFLGVRRQALRDLLRARGLDWVEDPSNEDARFQRVRVRRALESFGMDPARLAALARRMQAAQTVLRAEAGRHFARHGAEQAGTVVLHRAAFDAPRETVERVISAVIMALSSSDYRPRNAALRGLIDTRGGTLNGVIAQREGQGMRLFREPHAVGGIHAAPDQPWDGRWSFVGGRAPKGAQIAMMGAPGLTQLSRQAAQGMHPHWRETGLPRLALLGLPGLWYDGALVAAPLALWPQGWQVQARPVAAHPGLGGDLCAESH